VYEARGRPGAGTRARRYFPSCFLTAAAEVPTLCYAEVFGPIVNLVLLVHCNFCCGQESRVW